MTCIMVTNAEETQANTYGLIIFKYWKVVVLMMLNTYNKNLSQKQ